MKAVFFVKKDEYPAAKNRLYADDLVSRQSITIRDNAAVGEKKEGYFIQVEGDEKAIHAAKALLKEAATELKGKEATKIESAIESQEESAASGFGAIFG
jgi:hypothetical protein